MEVIKPNSFHRKEHFYQKAFEGEIHHTVKSFFKLTNEQIAARYCNLHTEVNKHKLEELMNTRTQSFYWGGTDLFPVITPMGYKKMVVIEMNSCPSGQKSMPLVDPSNEKGGYITIIEDFVSRVKEANTPDGEFAVIYDKNYVETSGYASVLADYLGRDVYLVPFYQNDESSIRFMDEILHIKDDEGQWIPIKAAFRYVTQSPWDRIPVKSKTFLYNPIVACLGGGRNKALAAQAYARFNEEMKDEGLAIRYPETIVNLKVNEVAPWVEEFNYLAVIKMPFSNCGQDIFIITSKEDLEYFLQLDHRHNCFIVQGMVGHHQWDKSKNSKSYYHLGTMPDEKGNSFIIDLRMIVASTAKGLRPVSLNARKARDPFSGTFANRPSKDTLMTNLSVKEGKDVWSTQTERLVIMDKNEFDLLGLGLDSLIESYVQSIMCLYAIDKIASSFYQNLDLAEEMVHRLAA